MVQRILIVVAAAAGIAALAGGRLDAGLPQGPVRIAVLISYKGEPFGEAVSGFHRVLSARGLPLRYVTHHLDGDAAKAAHAVRDARAGNSDLLFAIGSLAVEAASRGAPDIPTVGGMVLRDEVFRGAANLTGVYLEVSPEIQFRLLRRILPRARSVGVLYNPAENGERIAEAARAAAAQGLVLEAREVHSPRDLPAALESLGRRVDVLWGLYDRIVLAPEAAKSLLLFSFRHKIPVVGPSASWVKAGALYSIEWDYRDLGMQCGEMAVAVLMGASPGTIPREPPRKTFFVLNLNTARQLKIDLPESLVREAGHVYEGEP